MENKSNLNMRNIKNDEILLNCLKILKEQNLFDQSKFINNKLWKLFMQSDGSMTKNLQFLFPEIKMKLISTKIIDVRHMIETDIDISLTIIENFKNFINFEFSSDKIIQRKIIFYTTEDCLTLADLDEISSFEIKMIGLSFWDEDFYNELYSNKEEEKKPIGLIIIEKEIEFFKTIKNFVFNDINQNKFIFRFSSFKVKNKVALILLEIFEVRKFTEILGNFE